MSLKHRAVIDFMLILPQFDSLKVTVQISDAPLYKVLNMVFNNTAYYYTIISSASEVFLTKGKQINTQLAPGFLSDKQFVAIQRQVTASAAAPADFTGDKEHPVPEATTENKLYEIGPKTNTILPGTATLSGYIKNIKSGESVVGATIFVANTKTGVATDQFGYYTLKLPRGRQTLIVHGIGMRDTRRQIVLYSDGRLNIEMQEQVFSLKEVKISADKIANVRSTEMGVNHLDIRSIKQVPAVFGEPDILRVVLTLPGVQSVGEATTGF